MAIEQWNLKFASGSGYAIGDFERWRSEGSGAFMWQSLGHTAQGTICSARRSSATSAPSAATHSWALPGAPPPLCVAAVCCVWGLPLACKVRVESPGRSEHVFEPALLLIQLNFLPPSKIMPLQNITPQINSQGPILAAQITTPPSDRCEGKGGKRREIWQNVAKITKINEIYCCC